MTNYQEVNQNEIVLDCVMAILEEGQYTGVVLNAVLSKYQYLDKSRRAYIQRLVQGTVERALTLDYIIMQYSNTKIKKMKPVIRNAMRIAVYEIYYFDSMNDATAVNEAVKLVKKHGLKSLSGFVNGVLRNVIRGKDALDINKASLEVRTSIPKEILEIWQEDFGKNTAEQIAKSFLLESKTCIRVNGDRVSPDDLKKNLEKQAVIVEEAFFEGEKIDGVFYISGYDYLNAIESFKAGDFYVQDLSSIMVGEMLPVEKGDNCIDLCAAPGGKSLHIATKLRETGHVQARDLTEKKVSAIRENIEKSGLKNIDASVFDATVLDESAIGKFDIAICDVPCSGLGVIGHKPDLKYRVTKEDVLNLALLQKKILENGAKYVKCGGRIIYSTCTITKQENENQIRAFLKANADFSLEKEMQIFPKDGMQDGFYIALLKKN